MASSGPWRNRSADQKCLLDDSSTSGTATVKTAMAATTPAGQKAADQLGRHNDASLPGIPPELRLKIYNEVIASRENVVQPKYLTDSNPNSGKKECSIWALLRVCRLINREIHPLMPKIRDLKVQLYDFGQADLEQWLDSMGKDRLAEIRWICIDGVGRCSDDPENNDAAWDVKAGSPNAPRCYRMLELRISAAGSRFVSQYDMGDDADSPITQATFQDIRPCSRDEWDCEETAEEELFPILSGMRERGAQISLTADDVMNMWKALNADRDEWRRYAHCHHNCDC